MKLRKQTNRFIRIVRDNFVIVAIGISILLVAAVLGFRFLGSSREEVYVKVKVSQGLWWANTGRPNYWYIDSLTKGSKQQNLTGNTNAEIQSVRYYPYYDSSQYDVYVTLKLYASKKGDEYIFERMTLGVGMPIEFEFPQTQFTGTVIALSHGPFEEKTVEKTVVLQKSFAYPWEFDAIQIGEKYFDGERDVFEVMSKDRRNSLLMSQEANNNLTGITEPRQTVVVRAKILLKETGNMYIFGEEQIVRAGKAFVFATNAFQFTEYQIVSVE